MVLLAAAGKENREIAAQVGLSLQSVYLWGRRFAQDRLKGLQDQAGVSQPTISRIWSVHQIKPHLVRTFTLSREPHCAEKLRDVVGLPSTRRNMPWY